MTGKDLLTKWRDACLNAQESALLDYCQTCGLCLVCPFYDGANNIGELADYQIEELTEAIEEV